MPSKHPLILSHDSSTVDRVPTGYRSLSPVRASGLDRARSDAAVDNEHPEGHSQRSRSNMAVRGGFLRLCGQSKLIPVDEAAKMIGVSRTSAWKAVRTGELQVYAVSHHLPCAKRPRPITGGQQDHPAGGAVVTRAETTALKAEMSAAHRRSRATAQADERPRQQRSQH